MPANNGSLSTGVPTYTLLADIGGTNARFALWERGVLGPVASFSTAEYAQPIEVIRAFLGHQTLGIRVRRALLAVAGPVADGCCSLTNSSWVLDAKELRMSLGLQSVSLVNDFEAVAWSLSRLNPKDLHRLGGGDGVRGAPSVVLGPGTGLGVACFVPAAPRSLVIATEGGHATLPASNPQEAAVIDLMRDRFGHISAERALSGDGLMNLYQAIAALDCVTVSDRSAAEITEAALAGSCAVSRAALDLFCAMLGCFAGDLALIFGARGGVYIGGGIVPRFADYLSRSQFRERFEAKGRFRDYVRAIPTMLILHPYAALEGLATFLTPVITSGTG